MSLTENELNTRQKYDGTAEEWLEYSGGKNRNNYWAGELAELRLILPSGSKMLEIGCGPATDAKYMKEASLKVVSFDYSRSMLKIAKEISDGADLIEMDTYNIGVPDDIFDGFWASASLLHLEHPEKAIKEIVRVTKSDGVGFISVKEGDGDNVDPRTGYYFNYFRDDEFKNLLLECGLKIIKSGRKPGSKNHDWLTYIVKINK